MSLKRCESCGMVRPLDTPALRSIVYAVILVGGIILAALVGYYFVLGVLATFGVSFLVTWCDPANETS